MTSLAALADRAENSIMQTISIAVSAILIAAGLVTAPGLIVAARDSLAQTDLANVAYAEARALAESGAAMAYDNASTDKRALESAGNTRFVPSSGVRIIVDLGSNGTDWIAAARAAGSNSVWYRSSSSAVTTVGSPGTGPLAAGPGGAGALTVANVPATVPVANPNVPQAEYDALAGGRPASAQTAYGATTAGSGFDATAARLAALQPGITAATLPGSGTSAAPAYAVPAASAAPAASVAASPTASVAAPVPSFSSTSSGMTVSVDATASTGAAGATPYGWNWGDGTATATAGPTATHTYASAQPYTVTLTLSGSGGAARSIANTVVAGTGGALWDSETAATSMIANTAGASGSGVTAVQSTDQVHGGTYATRVRGTPDSNSYLNVRGSGLRSASANVSQTISLWVYPTTPYAAGETRAIVQYGYATSTGSTATRTAFAPLNTWTQLTFSYSPDTAAQISPLVGVYSDIATTFYVDDVTAYIR